MVIYAVVTDEPRLVRMNILPFLGRCDQRLTVPDTPVDKVTGAGKRIIRTASGSKMEEEHNQSDEFKMEDDLNDFISDDKY